MDNSKIFGYTDSEMIYVKKMNDLLERRERRRMKLEQIKFEVNLMKMYEELVDEKEIETKIDKVNY